MSLERVIERISRDKLFQQRIGEMESRRDLVLGSLIESLQREDHSATIKHSLEYGEVMSDIYWVQTLIDQGMPKSLIFRVWEKKDEKRLKGKEVLREKLENQQRDFS